MDALRVHTLGALGIVVVVRDVGPRQVMGDDAADAAHDISANAPITETNTRPPLSLLSAEAIGPSEPDELIDPRCALE